MEFLQEFFENVDFEKKADDKKVCNITQHAIPVLHVVLHVAEKITTDHLDFWFNVKNDIC